MIFPDFHECKKIMGIGEIIVVSVYTNQLSNLVFPYSVIQE